MDISTATTTVMDIIGALSNKATDLSNQAGGIGGEAASAGRDLWLGFLGINWGTPTWDIVILLFFAATIFVYSFAIGRDRIVAILISTYLALAVTTNFPFINYLADLLKSLGIFAFQAAAFLVVFLLLFVFLSRSQLVQNLSSFGGSLWQTVLFSFLQVGLLTSIILSFLPEIALDNISIFTKTLFISDLGRFCWVVLPILALVFIDNRDNRKRGPFGSMGI